MSNTDGLLGLTDLADAVRRSTALHTAMSITPADGTEADLMATADRLLVWLVRPTHQTYTPPAWTPPGSE